MTTNQDGFDIGDDEIDPPAFLTSDSFCTREMRAL
jgi:hypothetical protein